MPWRLRTFLFGVTVFFSFHLVVLAYGWGNLGSGTDTEVSIQSMSWFRLGRLRGLSQASLYLTPNRDFAALLSFTACSLSPLDTEPQPRPALCLRETGVRGAPDVS